MSAKRPKVPRELVGLYWRVKCVETGEWFTRKSAVSNMCTVCKLYRVTVWRVNK